MQIPSEASWSSLLLLNFVAVAYYILNLSIELCCCVSLVDIIQMTYCIERIARAVICTYIYTAFIMTPFKNYCFHKIKRIVLLYSGLLIWDAARPSRQLDSCYEVGAWYC